MYVGGECNKQNFQQCPINIMVSNKGKQIKRGDFYFVCLIACLFFLNLWFLKILICEHKGESSWLFSVIDIVGSLKQSGRAVRSSIVVAM